ncbi:FxLYD domain-containing protein [Streptomyces sp. NPDC048106]|uniref:FxLYD domain-containing protein n=1 Tax=Streptomyces sp. NPDC048106 TaxID=3155750 RepID=UPI0034551956
MGSGAPRGGRRLRYRSASVAAAAALATAGTATLAACGGGNNNGGGATPTARPSPPATASFTGTPPSPLSSAASSAIASARASASAAAASASARADEFEASVAAAAERANQKAHERLAKVQGRGNAASDVSLSGIPRAEIGDLQAAHVNIHNSSDRTADFAVQVDFRDADGKVVETRYVGAENVRAGQTVHVYAISHQPPQPHLNPVVAKAERY